MYHFGTLGNLRLGGEDIFLKAKNIYVEQEDLNHNIFSLYFLLLSRANVEGICYTTANEVSKVIETTKNRSRQLQFVKDGLNLLENKEVLRLESDYKEFKGNDTLKIKINMELDSWKPFYPRYFEIYSKIGSIEFNLYMMTLFYENIDTKSAFFSQDFARNVLKVQNMAIKDGFYLLQKNGYIKIKKSDLYWSDKAQSYRKMNNEYVILK